MCGRYEVTTEFSEIKLAFGASALDPTSKLDLSGNISQPFGPMDQAPLIIQGGTERMLTSGRFWYLPPSWEQPPKSLPTSFNARVERLLGSRFWRDAAEKRRCLVPAVHWFERDSSKKRDYQFSPESPEHRLPTSSLFAFAGLWADAKGDDGSSVRSFAIVTREADRAASEVHPRMPLIVHPNLYDAWLFATNVSELLSKTLDQSQEIPLTIVERRISKDPQGAFAGNQLDLFGRSR